MNFDAFGNLFPYEIIHIDRARFEKIFVDNFSISTSRRPIFNNYLAFIDVLKNNLQTPFYQWIDGSFVTSKQNPNDIL
ncbi:DUF6932 family protein [Runella limosa]|uniref:DUF6932 family protein n=1 Tax=Runella limosa TaxID=370978 RepID=UPI0003F72C1B